MNYDKDLICENITVDAEGKLLFAGQDTTELARIYETPVYLMDEDYIRKQCRAFKKALEDSFGEDCMVLYASKAASFIKIYEIIAEEGLGTDVVSCGEICTAKKAAFPMEKAFFHSNNKTDRDIAYAMDNGVGYFVTDNEEELFAIEKEASKRGIKQKILLRITPGIDPHTFKAVRTGCVDSKFGSAIETGQAEEITKKALDCEHVELMGFHCHIGSQIEETEIYVRTAEIMLDFIADIRRKTGYETKVLDLGGGFFARYTSEQPVRTPWDYLPNLGEYINASIERLGIPKPMVCIEPGRSIVAEAGMTLYTVGTIKKIPGYKNYVSVDGGMPDNIRFALYGSPYTILPANKMNDISETMTADVVGRCCESGDIIQPNVELPSSMKRGDILACLSTGAYHYSMANNYNRIPRPPVVMLQAGRAYVAVRRETEKDICALDI
jgi:diaminopimelate decarboxylase